MMLRTSFKKFAYCLMVGTLLCVASPAVVRADTRPPVTTPPTPATVSNDALPTVQIGDPSDPASNGAALGWAQVIVGNTVYVTGDFTTARPAGSAPGVNQVSRQHLLAYNITTGVLDSSFNVPLNGVGKAIAASPDGTRLYVGGKFTTAGGVAHGRIIAIDLTTKAIVSSFNNGFTSGTVAALVATNSTVYAGGAFSTTTTNVARKNLAAFSSTGALLPWTATTDVGVQSMVMSPTKPYIIFGGPFTTVNGSPYHSIGAVDATTAALIPWASQSATYGIRNEDPSSARGILSMAANANTIFLGGYNAQDGSRPAALEGRAAIDPNNGNIIWVNNCYGDTYGIFPLGQVLYSVGHPHDCSAIGSFPQSPLNVNTAHHAVAETIFATGVNITSPAAAWRTNYAGTPSSTQLDWYPDLTSGSYASQAAWSITGNASYVTLAGEFPTVNGVAQQGLVRFAVSSIAPNKSGPVAFPANSMFAVTADSAGKAAVRMPETYDRDNAVLTYKLYRDGSATPITTYTSDTRFWTTSTRSFTDSGLVAGSSHSYKLTASDPFGNTATTNSIPPSKYTAITPARVADTRPASGQNYSGRTIVGGTTLRVQVTGVGGVPASGVTAVVLNVAEATATSGGYVTVGTPNQPVRTSTLNITAGGIVNNQTVVALGGSNSVDVYASTGRTDVVVDVVGYYSATGSGFVPTTPARITDTRAGSGQPNAGARLAGGAILKVQAGGVVGIPATATSVVANVSTVGSATTSSYLSLYPSGTTRPVSSSVNYGTPTLTKEVTVKLGTDGAFSVYNAASSVDVIVAIMGYYVNGSGFGFVPVSPTRIADTRTGSGQPYSGSHLGTGTSLNMTAVGSAANVPAGAKAVTTNMSSLSDLTGSYLIAYPAGTARPVGTNVTFSSPVGFNETTVKLGTNSAYTITNNAGNTDVIVDVLGYYY